MGAVFVVVRLWSCGVVFYLYLIAVAVHIAVDVNG
jgi:hypothetical protein